MLRRILFAFAFTGCSSILCLGASAQEVVHALTGTVSSVDSASKTITVFLDSGKQTVFNAATDAKTQVSIDKKVLADSTAGSKFNTKGVYGVIFYYGQGDKRTAVAVRSLGSGPFTAVTGTVTEYHQHVLTVKDNTGAEQAFTLTAQTVAEGNLGAVSGLKFDIDKGDRVRIVGKSENGKPVALFVREM